MPKRALSRTPSVENNKRPRKHRYRPPKPSSASPMPPRTVNDLPLELLASILEHHKDVEPAKNLPLMLVCHRWRNCVETTPALWTEVSVHLRLSVYLNATKQIAAAVTKLDGYREHAGQVAMSVSVSAVEAYPNVIPADFRPLYDALGRFKGRIRSLTLGLHPIRLAALNELHTAHATLDLSNLQDLEIAATGEGRLDPPLAMFSTLPSLRSLCLQEMPLAFVLPPLVPWSQLTELTLSGYPSVDCMAPVSLAPNLTRLRVEAQPIEDDDDAPDRPENPVVLERLEDLEMYEAAGMQPRITDCFKFPNLRTVIVDATSYYRESDCRPPDPEADESDLDIIHPWDVQSLLSGKESKVHTVVLRTLWYSPWPAGVFHNIASVTELDVGPARRTFVQEFFRVFARYAFFPPAAPPHHALHGGTR
ncbi:RRM domain-containing protein [Mycena kentingensis (nom. inval.)]|nr:RRM domain-containing protein [Mycena kentingensis (nom. inval.)]